MQTIRKQGFLTAFLCTILFAAGLFIFFGIGKRITFCDEVYTYTIVNSSSMTKFFVNSWMSGEDFVQSLTQGAGDSFSQMIVNIKGDMVHPPLYYILVYIAAVIAGPNMSVWTGLAVNLLGFLGTSCILFLILKKLFRNPVISALGTVAVIWTQCMVSDAMLIRMYMLYTFFTVLFAYANLLLIEKRSLRNYLLLSASIVGGFMTQYYFVFFVCGFFAFDFIYNIKDRKYKDIIKYVAAIVAAFVIVTLLWSTWFEAITSNTHSEGIMGNAKTFLSQFGKLWTSYALVIAAVFQKADKVFMVLVPVLITAFFVVLRGTEHRVLRAYAARLSGVAFMYAFIVNVLTPAYLSSTRYYYACMVLLLAACVICVFGLVQWLCSRKEIRENFMYALTGSAVILLNAVLLATGYGVDYYCDFHEYDSTTKILEEYKDLPWIIGGDINWLIETSLMDYMIPERIMPLNSKAEVASDAFDGVDEFILVQNNYEDSEFVTRRNLYNYIVTTGKDVEVEKIVSRNYVSYYLCRGVEIDEEAQRRVDEFIENNMDSLWIVIDNDGWYDAKELFPEGEPENIIFIDHDTEYDTSGKYVQYDHAVMISSGFGYDVKDVGLYYMIGSTGRFYGGDYVGNTCKGKVAVYECEVIE